jgi:hypothetical protein
MKTTPNFLFNYIFAPVYLQLGPCQLFKLGLGPSFSSSHKTLVTF